MLKTLPGKVPFLCGLGFRLRVACVYQSSILLLQAPNFHLSCLFWPFRQSGFPTHPLEAELFVDCYTHVLFLCCLFGSILGIPFLHALVCIWKHKFVLVYIVMLQNNSSQTNLLLLWLSNYCSLNCLQCMARFFGSYTIVGRFSIPCFILLDLANITTTQLFTPLHSLVV